MTGFDREISRALHRNHGIVSPPVTSGDTAITGIKHNLARAQRGLGRFTASVNDFATKLVAANDYTAVPVAA